MVDMKVSVKDGKDIELDGVTVINTLSVAEKDEKKEEEAAPTTEAQASQEPAPEATVAPNSTVQTTISSLNPTIPNIEIPVPNVPTSIEPSPLTSMTPNAVVNSDVSALTTSNGEFQGQPFNFNGVVSTNDTGYNEGDSVNQEIGSSVFKTPDSVTASRNHFLDEVGKLFDERLTDPVNTSVIIANEAMKLLDKVFLDGMNVSSFKKYQELTDMYNGIKNVKDDEASDTYDDTPDYDYNTDKYNDDLSRMNIPRF